MKGGPTFTFITGARLDSHDVRKRREGEKGSTRTAERENRFGEK